MAVIISGGRDFDTSPATTILENRMSTIAQTPTFTAADWHTLAVAMAQTLGDFLSKATPNMSVPNDQGYTVICQRDASTGDAAILLKHTDRIPHIYAVYCRAGEVTYQRGNDSLTDTDTLALMLEAVRAAVPNHQIGADHD